MSVNTTVDKEFSFRKEASFWSAWLFGMAVSTVGAVSFIQHVFDVQLLPIYADGLHIYREVVHSFFGWLYAPFIYFIEWVASWLHFPLRIIIPGWWKDLATISSITMAAVFRSSVMLNRSYSERRVLEDSYRMPSLLYMLYLLFLGVTLVGLVGVVFMVVQAIWERRIARPIRYLIFSLFAVSAAAVAFFVTNAYAP
jgi:hypothetical protein